MHQVSVLRPSSACRRRFGASSWSADLITTLVAALSEQRGHLRAAAIVADVRLPETGSDAIRVTLEHSERIALTVLLPYKPRRFGRAIDYGDLRSEAASAFIWPS